jgi:hypothetical protein
MADAEPAPPGAGAEEDLLPPGMEEDAPAKAEEEKPAALPTPVPAVSAPSSPVPTSAPATTPVSAPQAAPTAQPAEVAPPPASSAPPAVAASADPVAAPAAAPAPVAQYPPYGYGAYPGYAPAVPVAGAYGYDPAAAAYWGYYGHAAPGDPLAIAYDKSVIYVCAGPRGMPLTFKPEVDVAGGLIPRNITDTDSHLHPIRGS